MRSQPAESSVPLHPLLAQRRSLRVLDASATVSDTQLTALLEAARWAPNWGNAQRTRLIAARRGEEAFTALTGTLSEGNWPWASRASALVLAATVIAPEAGAASGAATDPYPLVDLGLAIGQLITQAVAEDLVAHPMAGFDPEAAATVTGLPPSHRAVVLLAIGRVAPDHASPLGDRVPGAHKDAAPRTRLPLGEVAFDGTWGVPTPPVGA